MRAKLTQARTKKGKNLCYLISEFDARRPACGTDFIESEQPAACESTADSAATFSPLFLRAHVQFDLYI